MSVSAGITTENQARRIGFLPKCPRSAYSASAPVTQSTTAPRMTKVVPGWRQTKASAWCGLSADRISGCRTIWLTPSTASTANHRSVTGPKKRPMPAVPFFCTANRANRMTSVSGITPACSRGESTSRPSTADSTEIAGVMTPSP